MEFINKLFPNYALKRELSRIRLEALKRSYEGGQKNNYHPFPRSTPNPNVDMQLAGVNMRNRARYFDENLDLVVGILDTLVYNIVGNSNPIRPLVRRPSGELNAPVNEALLKGFNTFSRRPTACGQYTMMQALKLACRAWLRDGEYLTRFVRGTSARHHTQIPLSLELIEADYLPYDKTDEKNENGVKIVQGVELDKLGAVLGYHLYNEHPGVNFPYDIRVETHRVDADDIIHLKFTRRTHQVRGVTILHSVMLRLDDLKDYEESERIAARVSAAMTGFIEKNGEGLTTTEAGDDQRTFEMAPGMIFDNLLPGEKVGTIASNRPNPELINFRSSMLRAISAGTGANYSTISRDYMGTFSSQRQEILESKPAYMSLRQQFVDSYLWPIWSEAVKIQVAANQLPLADVDPMTLYDIETRGIDIGWIDPKKQAEATMIAINGGLTTRAAVIREQGGDPAAVFAEREEEKKLFPDEIIKPETNEQAGGEDEENEQNKDD